jgi:hypothetical protein
LRDVTSSKSGFHCTVVEIATHPILRAPRADRENPIHSQNTRVCVSCVTNTGLPKSTHSYLGTAGKTDLHTRGPWSGQGAKPSTDGPGPRSEDRSIAFPTRRVKRRVLPKSRFISKHRTGRSRVGRAEPTLVRRFGSRVKPPGEAGGLMIVSEIAGWCRCGLVDAERGQNGCPPHSRSCPTTVTSRGQTSQAKFSKLSLERR